MRPAQYVIIKHGNNHGAGLKLHSQNSTALEAIPMRCYLQIRLIELQKKLKATAQLTLRLSRINRHKDLARLYVFLIIEESTHIAPAAA